MGYFLTFVGDENIMEGSLEHRMLTYKKENYPNVVLSYCLLIFL